MKRNSQIVLASIFGTVFLTASLVIAIAIPHPSDFQYQVFRIALALAAGGVASMIPGIINLKYKEYLSASGALAVFSIVYFYSPVQLAVNTAKEVMRYVPPRSMSEQQNVLAEQTFNDLWLHYRTTLDREVSVKDVIEAHRKYVLTRIALEATKENRVRVLQAGLEECEAFEELTEKRYNVGELDRDEVLQAMFYQKEREVALAAEQSLN